MSLALQYLLGLTVVPSEMRTAEWSLLPVWTRERAFWIAGLDRVDAVQEIRNRIGAITAGAASEGEARHRILDYLDAIGYNAPEGLEGTIKDLRSDQRLDVMIRTNVEMARGWAREQRFAGSIDYPAKRLVRVSPRQVPRDWAGRCAEFGGRSDVVLLPDPDAPMVALSDSPVWALINRFGNAYPPFDFNSGMGVDWVSLEECRDIGLITSDNEEEVYDRMDAARRPDSLNSHLEARRDYRDRDLRDSITDTLQGLVEWRGDTLVFTDPNGSRPYDWDQVGRIINATLPEGLPSLQATALRHWVQDHTAFEGDAWLQGKVGWDEREDLARLVARINPLTSGDYGRTLYRGMALDNDILDQWYREGAYSVKAGKMFDSWSDSLPGAEKYLKPGMDNAYRHNVLLVMQDYADIRPLHGAIRATTGITSPDPAHPLRTDSELIALPRHTYKIVRTESGPDDRIIITIRQERRPA